MRTIIVAILLIGTAGAASAQLSGSITGSNTGSITGRNPGGLSGSNPGASGAQPATNVGSTTTQTTGTARTSGTLGPVDNQGGLTNGGQRFMPTATGGLISRQNGSGSGFAPDGQGGYVGTGSNAGKRCISSNADNFRCY